MAEIWRPIPGFPGYEASSTGSIRSLARVLTISGAGSGRTSSYQRRLRGRVMRPQINFGYRIVPLVHADGHRRLCRVACLVALAFIGPRPVGTHVCHRDGSRNNDAVGNLSYGTPRENAEDKRRHGTLLAGDTSPVRKLDSEKVRLIRALASEEDRGTLAQRFGVTRGQIRRIVTGENWRAA